MSIETTTAPEHTAEPIDRSHLARFTLGNMALEREVLELFAGQLPHYVAQLRASASGKEWKLVAHTIKGSALAVGARRLAGLAQSAEHLAMDDLAPPYVPACREAAAAIAAASEDVCRYISGLLASDEFAV